MTEAVQVSEASSFVSQTGSFLRAYEDYSTNLTDAPEIYHSLISLNLLSLAVGDRPIAVTPKDILPNVWLLLVGLSGVSRKTTSANLAKDILPSGSILLPNEYTKESLIEELSSHPQGIGVWDECGSLLKQLSNPRSYTAGVEDILCLLYSYRSIFRRKLRSGEFTIMNPCFNLLWATTLGKFVRYVSAENISSGLFARFLIVYGERGCPKSRRNQTDEDSLRRTRAKELLQEVYDFFHSGKIKKFVFDPEALELINAWQAKHEEEIDQIADPEQKDIQGAIVTRLGEYLIKFSALYEVDALLSKGLLSEHSMNGDTEFSLKIPISVDSAGKSMSLIDNLLSTLRTKILKSLSSTLLSRNLVKLTNILEKAGEEWVQRQYVLPRMNMEVKDFNSLLDTACESWYVETKGSRPMLIKLLKKPE